MPLRGAGPRAAAWANEAVKLDLQSELRSETKPVLNKFQQECVEAFQRAAASFNLPPSVGQIYGLLFSTEEELNLEQIMKALGASRGGTFQGLRWLREVGAIHGVTKSGKRSQFYRAELNLRKLAGAFLHARIEPHLENGAVYLERLKGSLAEEGAASAEFQLERWKQMERWHHFISDILPFIRTFAARF